MNSDHDDQGEVKVRIDVFADGTIAMSEMPPGFNVEVERVDLTQKNAKRDKPTDAIHDPDENLVKQIKAKGTDKFSFDKTSKKLKENKGPGVIDESPKSP